MAASKVDSKIFENIYDEKEDNDGSIWIDKEPCAGSQIFCRIGKVKRTTHSLFRLTISVFGTKKSVRLFEGRELCISHRPGRCDDKNWSPLEAVRRTSMLHEPITMTITLMDVPASRRRQWSKQIGSIGAFEKPRVVFLSAGAKITVSVLVGVHHYNLLPPVANPSSNASRTCFVTKSAMSVSQTKSVAPRAEHGMKPDESEPKLERLVIVGESEDAPFLPHFVPAPDSYERNRGVDADADADGIVWYRRRDVHPNQGGSEPQPYLSYADYLQNRLSKHWAKHRLRAM